MPHPYQLAELVPAEELSAFIENLAATVNMSCSISDFPTKEEIDNLFAYQDFLDGKKEVDDEILIKMTNALPSCYNKPPVLRYRESDFCRQFRQSILAKLRCAFNDILRSQEAYSKRKAIIGNCPHADLIDIVAPIVVGDHHIANIYIGQIFPHEWKCNVDDIFRKYRLESNGVDEAKFKKSYQKQIDIKPPEKAQLEIYAELLFEIARLLSLYATTRAGGKLVTKIWCSANMGSDTFTIFRNFFDDAKKLIHFDTCSFWVKDDIEPEKIRCLYANWINEVQPADLEQMSIYQNSVLDLEKLVMDRKREIMKNKWIENNKNKPDNIGDHNFLNFGSFIPVLLKY
jgi:hypothetical protein